MYLNITSAKQILYGPPVLSCKIAKELGSWFVPWPTPLLPRLPRWAPMDIRFCRKGSYYCQKVGRYLGRVWCDIWDHYPYRSVSSLSTCYIFKHDLHLNPGRLKIKPVIGIFLKRVQNMNCTSWTETLEFWRLKCLILNHDFTSHI